jgi:hypothetical protein
MNAKPLSQSEFDRLKAEALRAEPVAKKVMLNRIELTDNSYADGVVKIDGRGVSADTSFFKGLSKILNISKGMQDDLTGESGGPSSLYPKMVEAMKNLRGGGRTVTIVGDPVSGGLMGVYDKDPGRIPNADLFRVTEGLLNRYPGLSPVEINVNDGGMGVGISLLSSADIGFGNHGGPDGGDESFRFGFTLGSIDTQTSLGDFMYRLVCANGIMGTSVSEQFKLKDLSPRSIEEMFKHISNAASREFVPVAFENNLKNAASTFASFRELEETFNSVLGNLRTNKDEPAYDHQRRELAQSFFRGYAQANAKLIAKGIDPHGLSKKQKAFIVTGQTVWDVINSLSWLGSHDGGYPWKDQALLRKLSGKMMGTEADLANLSLLSI